MGSDDTTTAISVITLDAHLKSGVSSVDWFNPSLFEISSECVTHGATNNCAVSWSGIGLKEDDGWFDIANGSLFVHLTSDSSGFDPFGGRKEIRDDVVLEGSEFVYVNGYSIKGPEGLAVYHVILPQYYFPTDIGYLRLDGLEFIHARIISDRAIITWVYRHAIQLRIAFRRRKDSVLARKDLYKLALKNFPKHAERSEFIQEMKRSTAKELVSSVPRVIQVIGSMW